MKIAALDVGTNTVLMLVVETGPAQTPQAIAEFSRITRLGRGVDASGRLDPAAARTTLDTIAEFTEKARALGAETILTAATAALRDASDGPDFIARVQERTGLILEVISGRTEAELVYLASVKGLHLQPSESLLIVDIGGGSTELIRAQAGASIEVTSLQIGSVRLTERIIQSDPPHARDAAELRIAIDQALATVHWNFKPDTMVGIAGTVTTVCAVALGMTEYDAGRAHGYRLSRAEVLRVLGMIGCVTLEQRKRIAGIDPGRADVILAGTAILERVMAHFECESVLISDQGVRWGLVWREIEKRASAQGLAG